MNDKIIVLLFLCFFTSLILQLITQVLSELFRFKNSVKIAGGFLVLSGVSGLSVIFLTTLKYLG